MATDLNDLGQVVGYSETPEGETHAFLWDPVDGMIDLGTLGGALSQSRGIDSAGRVVGTTFTADPSQAAFLWQSGGGMVPLESGGAWADATDLNEDGLAVGQIGPVPVRWLPGQPARELGFVLQEGYARRVNASGAVCGSSDLPAWSGWLEAVVWTPDSTLVELGALSEAGSDAWDINDQGEVVGVSAHDLWSPTVAVYWDRDGVLHDLNEEAPAGLSILRAVGINEHGDIAAVAFDGEAYQACLLRRLDPSTLVESARAPGLRIYPNPAAGEVRLDLPAGAPGPVELVVLSPEGRVVHRSVATTSGAGTTLLWNPPVQSMRAGVYFLRTREADGRVRSGRVTVLSVSR